MGIRIKHSVTTRMVVCLVVSGLLASIGFGVLEWRRAEQLLRMQLTQRVSLTTRNLQSLLRGVMDSQRPEQLGDSLRVVTGDTYVRAVAVSRDGEPTVRIGNWQLDAEVAPREWLLPEHGLSWDGDIDFQQLTVVRAPFMHAGKAVTLQLLVDGSAAWHHARSEMWAQLQAQWLILGIVCLLGLLMLRRWLTGPLSDLSELVSAGAGPESFYDLSRQMTGEFGQLTEAVAGMLTRLECTTQRLRQREQAFENLYQFAPAAMLSLASDGRIVEANRRAASLLGVAAESELISQLAADFVCPDDRHLMRQTLERLDLDDASRCELRIKARSRTIDVMLECAAVRDDDGALYRIRLSMLDISQSRRLQRQLGDKTRLLNLVIDHISDALLLVDERGRIAAYNQKLITLLRRRPDSLAGETYNLENFWDELGILEHDTFTQRMRQIETEQQRPAHLRAVTRQGAFLFQGIPVLDGDGQSVGRLWAVQEITAQEQAERLVKQQSSQIHALKRLGYELRDVRDTEDLLVRAGQMLYDLFDVEALGIAIRRGSGAGRSRQIIFRGHRAMLRVPNQGLVDSIEQHLMPRMLQHSDVAYWPDMPRGEAFAQAFEHAGLTSVAAGSLQSNADAQGVLWIARRGGERIDRQHIHLLEAVLPVVAARVEYAQQLEQLNNLQLTDPVTHLGNRRRFDIALSNLTRKPGHPWSLMLISVDHFSRLNEQLGHDGADALLRRIGLMLRERVRKNAEVARLHGKLFAVLCPDLPRDGAAALAERLGELFAGLDVFTTEGDAIEITASIGLAACPEDGIEPTELLGLADARVEHARRAGRNRVVADSAEMKLRAG